MVVTKKICQQPILTADMAPSYPGNAFSKTVFDTLTNGTDRRSRSESYSVFVVTLEKIEIEFDQRDLQRPAKRLDMTRWSG